jgi:hypothetical protein
LFPMRFSLKVEGYAKRRNESRNTKQGGRVPFCSVFVNVCAGNVSSLRQNVV